jgi:hypothetical protein
MDPNKKGDQVGSSQSDQFQDHNHATTATARWGDRFGGPIGFGGDDGERPGGNQSLPTTHAGGSETRPGACVTSPIK